MNMRRGNESKYHLAAKKTIGLLFDQNEWSVFYEQRNADVIVLHHTTRFVAAIELESTPRNVICNCTRNTTYGCQSIAVVSLTERYLNQITNKILSHIENHGHIKVFFYDVQGLNELRNWIENLALSHKSDTGVNA